MQQLHWVKSKAGTWLQFQSFDMSTTTEQGVYIIWHTGNPGRVVYVGQGDVNARLTQHRSRRDINQYANFGELRVTWASVSANLRDGVERYLADTWNPLVGDAYPQAMPVAVNSPW